MCIREEHKQLAIEIGMLCRNYQRLVTEVEKRAEGMKIREKLGRICQGIKGKLEIGMPELLLALLDTYEVTRDEGMLQEVLDVVSGHVDRLAVSAEAVKLLAYCYYYVEEEECAVKAREILEELKKRGGSDEEVTEAEKMLEEFCWNDELS